jgi:hypothetical protein
MTQHNAILLGPAVKATSVFEAFAGVARVDRTVEVRAVR